MWVRTKIKSKSKTRVKNKKLPKILKIKTTEKSSIETSNGKCLLELSL